MTIGQNAVGAAFDVTTTRREHELGTRMRGPNGDEFVYTQADGAIAATDVVIITEAGQADAIDTTNSASAIGTAVGVANVAFADNEYGWVQVRGATTANVGTSSAAGDKLNSTGTAGRLDDDGTSGAETVLGLYPTATAADNSAPVVLQNPFIDATL
ncbi:MAG: hypothetical protein AAF762_00260 [Pseudomonadota bacterium]